jgi:hypothetical protein
VGKTEPSFGESIQEGKGLILLLLIAFLIGLDSPGSNFFPFKTILEQANSLKAIAQGNALGFEVSLIPPPPSHYWSRCDQ